jgi:hypothetical protein
MARPNLSDIPNQSDRKRGQTGAPVPAYLLSVLARVPVVKPADVRGRELVRASDLERRPYRGRDVLGHDGRLDRGIARRADREHTVVSDRESPMQSTTWAPISSPPIIANPAHGIDGISPPAATAISSAASSSGRAIVAVAPPRAA